MPKATVTKERYAKISARARTTGKSKAQSRRYTQKTRRRTSILQWIGNWWNTLASHHQQCIISAGLLVLSLVLFCSLTFFQTTPVLSEVNYFFQAIFGWSAYLLAVGLIAFAATHLIEGIRQQQFMLISLIIGLACIWLLLLAESALFLGSDHVGLLGSLLVLPLLGWPSIIDHMIVIGLLLIAIFLTFRLTFGHVLLVTHYVKRVVPSPALSTNKTESNIPPKRQPSPFLGQRPQYSRYTIANIANGTDKIEDEFEAPVQGPYTSLQEDETETELEDDDDPLNDINIHKQRTARNIQRQLPLSRTQTDKQNTSLPGIIAKLPVEMEPLAPNPRLLEQTNQPKTASASQAQALTTKARANKQSTNERTQSSQWRLPGIALLNSPNTVKLQTHADHTSELVRIIQQTLHSFRVAAEVRPEDVSVGPTVIRFGIRPTGKPQMHKNEKSGKMEAVTDTSGNIVYESRTRVSRIMALQDDLALVLEATTIRMEAPVPGRPYVGVEIPNRNSRLVTLREVLETSEYQADQAKSKLAIGLGKDVAGLVRVGDLAKMPHLLIAGATGSGKSICLNTIIASILMQATPDEVRLLMVDPKMVELKMYDGIPHLLAPVVIEVDKVVSLLKNAIREMERRYRLFSQLGVRNLDGYRKLRMEKLAKRDHSLDNLPAIVIIIDELADLMMAAAEEVEGMICRLAQLARATGIHLIVATQRPSVDVITGLIKANIPSRISFMVSSAVDSRTIIDMGGAERLLGRGDMLYLPADVGKPERIQGAFLSDEEAQRLADFWRQQAFKSAPDGNSAPTRSTTESEWELKANAASNPQPEDDLLDKAEEIVHEYGQASISLLQRRLRVGYPRAARLIELLEQRGIIGRPVSGRRGHVVRPDGNTSSNDQGSHHDKGDRVTDERARHAYLHQQATHSEP